MDLSQQKEYNRKNGDKPKATASPFFGSVTCNDRSPEIIHVLFPKLKKNCANIFGRGGLWFVIGPPRPETHHISALLLIRVPSGAVIHFNVANPNKWQPN